MTAASRSFILGQARSEALSELRYLRLLDMRMRCYFGFGLAFSAPKFKGDGAGR